MLVDGKYYTKNEYFKKGIIEASLVMEERRLLTDNKVQLSIFGS